MPPITEVAGRRLALSNLDKVLYPATGTTKGELLHYCAALSGPLLAHLRGRPVSFLRFPDGPDGRRFFSKNPPPGTPTWLPTVQVPRSRGTGSARQVLIADLPGLMWAANLVTEFHAPQWRADLPAIADRLVLDLDPGEPAGVLECAEVALWLRERLAGDGLGAYAKTSGSKGLHVLVPVVPTPAERVSAYAKLLAVEAAAALPGLAIHRMRRDLRPGRVFVDWSQNSAGKTTAVPYTPRARPEPTVSTPVTWAEVAAGRLDFRIEDLPARLERYGDLLAPLLNAGRAGRVPAA
jgi:bifunctional non-homologous end joining protein LigD